MTSYAEAEARCPACTTTFEFTALASTSYFHPPDLDLRPAGVAHTTHTSWVHACPHCAFPYADDAEEERITVLDAFRAGVTVPVAVDDPVTMGLALRGALEAAAGESRLAGACLLAAAWCADDDGDDASARTLRLAAADAWDPGGDDPERCLQTADALRRAEAFDRATATLGLAQPVSDPDLREYIELERRLIEQRDLRAFCVDGTPREGGRIDG